MHRILTGGYRLRVAVIDDVAELLREARQQAVDERVSA